MASIRGFPETKTKGPLLGGCLSSGSYYISRVSGDHEFSKRLGNLAKHPVLRNTHFAAKVGLHQRIKASLHTHFQFRSVSLNPIHGLSASSFPKSPSVPKRHNDTHSATAGLTFGDIWLPVLKSFRPLACDCITHVCAVPKRIPIWTTTLCGHLEPRRESPTRPRVVAWLISATWPISRHGASLYWVPTAVRNV